MATQFDEEGFSAVAAFFGKGGNSSSSEDPAPPLREASSHGSAGDATGGRRDSGDLPRVGPGRRRLGLGASSSTTKEDASDPLAGGLADARKQLLGVGRKGRRRGGRHDEDEDEVADNGEESDSDEDEGRTSAVKRLEPRGDATEDPSVDAASPRKKKSKKKKKKKKGGGDGNGDLSEEPSRISLEADKIPQEEGGGGIVPPQPEASNSDMRREDASDVAEEEKGREDGNEGSAAPNKARKRKRKRPKVRSRQKNIRKDTRSNANKPGHIVPGGQDYTGRSLTRETRERLNLPESNTSTKHRKMMKRGFDSDAAAGAGHKSGGGYDLGLAVDDYLDVGDAVDGGGAAQESTSKDLERKVSKSEKKKRKKSKYKNV